MTSLKVGNGRVESVLVVDNKGCASGELKFMSSAPNARTMLGNWTFILSLNI